MVGGEPVVKAALNILVAGDHMHDIYIVRIAGSHCVEAML